uniref:Tumor suppressor p53-binding protein 1 n=2 Tax=Schistocephalus solidus TaxID=70667 RepID=A0A0V0J467_SCHSO
MDGASEEDIDANIIPSSNIEPPPPVTYVMPIMKQFTSPLTVSSPSRLTRHALSYTDSPSYAMEANLFSQADEFEDTCSSNNSRRSKGNVSAISTQLSSHQTDLKEESGRLSEESQNTQLGVLSHASPDANLPLRKMLESTDASLDLRDIALSRCSDIASPAPRGSTAEMSSLSQKVRASAPPPTTLPRTSDSRTSVLTSLENLPMSRPSSISAGSFGFQSVSETDLLKSDSHSSGTHQECSAAHGLLKTPRPPDRGSKDTDEHMKVSTISDASYTQLPSTCVLTLHILEEGGRSGMKYQSTQFSNSVCWQAPNIHKVDGESFRLCEEISSAADILTGRCSEWLHKTNPQARISSGSSGYFCPRIQQSALSVWREPAVLLHRVSRATESTGSSSGIPVAPSERLTQSPSRASSETPTLTSDALVPGEAQSISSLVPILPLTSKPESSSSELRRPILSAGDRIYGKWRTDNYFYAGHIVKVFSKNRIRVHFDDNSSGLLSADEIIGQPLLPVGANVAADLLGEGEYEAGYVIADSKTGDSPDVALSYAVRNVESGKLFTLQRARVAITEEEVVRLNAAGLLGQSPLLPVHDSIASSPPSSVPDPSVQNTSCLRSPSNAPTANLSTPEVSLDNLVYGKRSTARRITKQATASVSGTQSSRRLHTAPNASDSTEPPFEDDGTTSGGRTSSNNGPNSVDTVPVKRKKKALSSQRRMNRRDSQLLAFRRRAVASASMPHRVRASQRVGRAARRQLVAASVTRQPLSAPAAERETVGSLPSEPKRQRLLDLSDRFETPRHPLGPVSGSDVAAAHQTTLLVPDSEDTEFTQPMTDGSCLTDLPSIQNKRSRLTRTTPRRTAVPSISELTRLCRKYNIPPPASDLFSSWAVVLTSGVSQSGPTDRSSLQLSSTAISTQHPGRRGALTLFYYPAVILIQSISPGVHSESLLS